MASLRRLVIDVLKPHDPPLDVFTEALAETKGVEGVNASLIESDEKVANVKFTLVGEDMEFDSIEDKVEEMSGSLHSTDEVVSGEVTVDEVRTPQDKH
ncbi:MAG: DUF211 domain-containing protein [Halobacteria archaeon]